MFKKLVIASSIFASVTCFSATEVFLAEDTAYFKPGGYSCKTLADYKEFVYHIQHGEKTLASKMLKSLDCVQMYPGYDWKVISSDYGFSDCCYVQVESETETMDIIMWTGAEQISKSKT